ncbi:hypothetical protein BESB_061010 [Besnoitia besnoiti]|uniref:Transmembrane protein n=1 Tax=Besnoitia besnoiti TaxID=94643 RepID=A0A2A9MDD3_BESBE|nr:hypothetical protein BESB_061010 [Besnoitia besnoiti]PFH35214.1 hypothetical protein BESB_061010 [Besnoitia besnoiti]
MRTKSIARLCILVPLVAGSPVSALETDQAPNHVIQQLRQQIGNQQQAVAALEQEVAGLLRELRSGREEFQAGAGGGLRLEINYPHPGGAGAEASSEAFPWAREEEAAAGPIPIMVVKPSSVADVESAMTQVMEQEAAMTGVSEAQVNAPMPFQVKSPEQQLDDAVAAIDKLEAEKTHYKYDIENLQRNYAA